MERTERLKRLRLHLKGLENFKNEPQTATTLSRFVDMTACLISEAKALVEEEGVTDEGYEACAPCGPDEAA